MYVHACSPAHSIYAYSNGFPSFHVYNMLILLIIFLILHIANPNGWCRSYIQNIRIMCTTYSWYSWLLHSLPPARPKRHQNNHNLNIIIDCLGISLLIKSYESEIEMILKSEMRFVVWLSFPSGYIVFCFSLSGGFFSPLHGELLLINGNIQVFLLFRSKCLNYKRIKISTCLLRGYFTIKFNFPFENLVWFYFYLEVWCLDPWNKTGEGFVGSALEVHSSTYKNKLIDVRHG